MTDDEASPTLTKPSFAPLVLPHLTQQWERLRIPFLVCQTLVLGFVLWLDLSPWGAGLLAGVGVAGVAALFEATLRLGRWRSRNT